MFAGLEYLQKQISILSVMQCVDQHKEQYKSGALLRCPMKNM